MEKKYLLLTISLFAMPVAMAQSFAINTDGSTAHTSALLDVKSNGKGVLVPRMTKAERTAIASPATGLLVFQNAPDSIGFYYYEGSKWNWVAALNGNADSLAWKRNGNAGTNPAANFIGTTDNQPISFRQNDQWMGRWNAGTGNYSIGKGAGQNITTAGNIAMGDSSLAKSFFGNGLTAIGQYALKENLFGSWNTAVGHKSLMNLTNSNFNTAVGTFSLNASTAEANTATGHYSLGFTTTGSNNVANGAFALFNNISGFSNVAIGIRALNWNSGSSNLVAVGDSALYNNGGGTSNTAVGSKSLYANTTGTYNTATGFQSLNQNSSGSNNTAIGSHALILSANGSANTAVGSFSLSNLINSNNYNVAIGDSAARNLTSGANNVVVGSWAFKDHTTGSLNTAIGNFAMGDREAGNYNTAVGGGSLWNTNNDYNTGIGYYAGYQNISGIYNTYLGTFAYASLDNFTNATAIGANSTVNASNKVRIGSPTVTVIEGQVAYTFPSDGRFKTAVTESVSGLDFITKLRPVIYNFQTEKYDAFIKGEENKDLKPASLIDYSESEKVRHSGFIAQEVVKAAREAGYEFDGIVVPKNSKETYGLAYSQFVVPLVKAVQEQQKQIDDLKKQIAELKAKIKVEDPER